MSSFMLDSNVWEKVVAPEEYKTEPLYKLYKDVHDKLFPLNNTEIYISSVIFDFESIKKNERLLKISKYKPAFSINTESINGTQNTSFIIGPSNFDYSLNPYLEKHAESAFKEGFKVTTNSRVGLPINPLRKDATIHFTNKQNEAIAEASNFIEKNLHAGMYHLEELIKECGIRDKNLLKAIKQIPQNKNKNFIKAIAEWCDGDAIAECIGMRIEYFVTLDNAQNAGTKSVLSKQNRMLLKQQYPFLNIISLEEMLKIIK